jgi:hypothetical protein
VAAYQTANDPGTRSPVNIVAKDTAKAALEAQTRMLARIVRANRAVTSTMRVELGLSQRNGGGKSPAINPPDSPPRLDILSICGWTVRLNLRSADSTRRGKPKGVRAATILGHVGDNPPSDAAQWSFLANTSVTTVDVSFRGNIPAGAKVWLTACWQNPRGDKGPWSEPVSTHVGFGGMKMAA